MGVSKYTFSLRSLCDNFTEDWVLNIFKDYDLSNYLTSNQIEVINTYGVWSKEKLADLILGHYYMREIGYETPTLFARMFKYKIRELMGYYAELIYSASIEYDMLVNVNYTETTHRTTETEGRSSDNSTATSLGINSDTPQSEISKSDILEGKYASNTAATEGNANTNSNVNNSGTEDIVRSKKGNDGVLATNQKLIQQYRDNIRNINYEIIKDLSDMFIGLY